MNAFYHVEFLVLVGNTKLTKKEKKMSEPQSS